MKKASIKKISIIYNPISGKGEAGVKAKELKSLLLENDFEVTSFLSTKELESNDEIQKHFSSAELVIISGGDGTLRSFLSDLSSTGTPVYFIPSGNESLFAKEFLMSSEPKSILDSIKNGIFEEHFIVSANKEYFFTMLSLGFDSLVVKEFSDRRRGTISHRDYILPLLLSLKKFKAPKVSLFADGELVVDNKQGFLIVSNNPQYALGINFVPEANSKDEFLTVRFFECKSFLKHFLLCLKFLFSKPQKSNDNVFLKARKLKVELDENFPVQVDGDLLKDGELKFELEKKQRIKILLP